MPAQKKKMTPMKKKELKKLKKIFDAIDTDESGMITADELLAASDQLDLDGITPARIKKMMKEADTDGDGGVDFDEFVEVMKTSKEWQGCATPSLLMKSVMYEADAMMAVGDGVLAPVRASFVDQAPLRSGKAPLASLGTRFISKMFTACTFGAAGMVAYAGIAFGLLAVFGGVAAGTAVNFNNDEDAIAGAAASMGMGLMLMAGAGAFWAFFLIINLSLLCKGQSPGKWCVGTHVVHKRDGTPVSCCANLIRTLLSNVLYPYLACHLLCCAKADSNQHFVDMCFDTEVVHKVHHTRRA